MKQMRKRPRKGGKGWELIARPIYPRHVFVGFSGQIWGAADVCQLRPIIGVLGFGGKPAKIPDAEMQRFLERLAQPEPIAPQFHLRKGVKVAIKTGTFAQLNGTVDVIDGTSAKVLIDLFGRSCETTVKVEDLEELIVAATESSDNLRKGWTTRSKSLRRNSGRSVLSSHADVR